MIKKLVFSVFLLFGIAAVVNAQSAASPYSIFGIGTLSGKGLTYHNSMGGLGISNGKPYILNNINPALLPMNSFTTFDAGLSIENRVLRTTDLKQSNINGGLSYLALGFPLISGKWSMALGLSPYSNVSYNIVSSGNVINHEEATSDRQNVGSGGLNQVYMSSGWQLIPKFLYAGGRIGYTFGTINDETFLNITEIEYSDQDDEIGTPKQFDPSVLYRSTHYSDFLFEGGLYARKTIGKKVDLNVGLTYEFSSDMKTTRNERIEATTSDPIPPTDTIVFDARGKTFLPQKLGVGISLSKAYKWTFGVDFYSRDWSKFESEFGQEQELVQNYQVIVGGEFTPDITSVTSYMKRVTYQFGINYEQTPVKINNTNIDDFGINFGLSLPVGNASIFNVGVKYGQLGTTSNGLIKENYYKINLGMTFNDRSFGWYRNQRKIK